MNYFRAHKTLYVNVMLLVLFVGLLTPCSSPVFGQNEDWLDDWAYRIPITISSSDVDEVLTNFPTLIHLSSSCGIDSDDVTAIFDEVGADYDAIAYTSSDGQTQLYFDPDDYWNATAEEAFVWVKVPSISNTSDTTLYLYYNSTQDGSAYNSPTDVWDSDFVMVQHMNDNPDTSHVMDSTSNDNDGTKTGADNPLESTGEIGMSQIFDGEETISIVEDGDFDFGENIDFSIAFWTKTETTSATFLGKYHADNFFYVQINADGTSKTRIWDGTTQKDIVSTSNVADNVYNYIVFVFDRDGDGQCYVNGVVDGSAVDISVLEDFDNDINLAFGGFRVITPSFVGLLDEIRISNISRSSGWVGASYETQRDHFIAYGSTEETPDEYDDVLAIAMLGFTMALTAITLVIIRNNNRSSE